MAIPVPGPGRVLGKTKQTTKNHNEQGKTMKTMATRQPAQGEFPYQYPVQGKLQGKQEKHT